MTEIRPASEMDDEAIRAIHISAFPTAAEANLVESLQRDGDSRISLVAIDNGRAAGHILFSRMDVGADGRTLEALGLAPVAVLPALQRRGVGSALTQAGLKQARQFGADMVFVLGDVRFYGKFGFEVEAARPFVCQYSGPHLQAQVLNDELRATRSGTASYARAFDAL
jgi:putative acetyltransferase